MRNVARTAPPISQSVAGSRPMKTSLTTGFISQALSAVAPAITAMKTTASASQPR